MSLSFFAAGKSSVGACCEDSNVDHSDCLLGNERPRSASVWLPASMSRRQYHRHEHARPEAYRQNHRNPGRLVPAAAVIAYLINPSNPTSAILSKEALDAASSLGIEAQFHVLNASTVDQLDEAFASSAKQRPDALVVLGEPYFDSQRTKIVALSARYGLAGCYPWREYNGGRSAELRDQFAGFIPTSR